MTPQFPSDADSWVVMRANGERWQLVPPLQSFSMPAIDAKTDLLSFVTVKSAVTSISVAFY